MSAGAGTATSTRTGLYLILGLAVLVGVVGGLLLAGAPAPPAPRAGEVQIDLPTWGWGLLFLLPMFAAVAGVVVQRVRGGGARSRRGLAVALVIIVGALIALGVLLAIAHPGPQGSVTVERQSPPTNSTPPSNHTGTSGGSGSGTGPIAGASTVTINGWEILAVALGLVGLVTCLTIPGLLGRGTGGRRSEGGPAADPETVRAALGDAQLAIGKGGDPRETVVQLYLRLIRALEPHVGSIEPLTAREIRRRLLEPLGVRGAPAQELTDLFEEARYSRHPMGPEAATRCQRTLAAVEADLARSLGS